MGVLPSLKVLMHSGYLLKEEDILILFILNESSHGKGPFDVLCGVTKSLTSTAVCAGKLIIRNGKELYDF